jgi:hypothetical protein
MALVLDDATGRVFDIDTRGAAKDVIGRLELPSPEPEPESRRPGRPKLGVVAREVTLLPRALGLARPPTRWRFRHTAQVG